MLSVVEVTRRHIATPDPGEAQAKYLRKRAQQQMEAAAATDAAVEAEEELREFSEKLESQADVQLGLVLLKRKIKPGAVVTNWAKSKGEHAGELSKAEFRKEVLALGLGNCGCTAADVDAVFDKFDADGGGWMDAEEAAAMVKGLQQASEAAETEKRAMERKARGLRARATKKAEQALIAVKLPTIEEDAGVAAIRNGSPGGGSPMGSPGAGRGGKPKKRREDRVSGEAGAPAVVKALSTTAATLAEVGSAIANGVGGLIGQITDRGGSKGGGGDGGGSSSKVKEEVELKVKGSVVKRMGSLLLWRGWGTWCDYHYSIVNAKDILSRMQHLPLIRGFEAWQSYVEGIYENKRTIANVLNLWLKAQVASGFRAWYERADELRMEKERRRISMRFASRLKCPRVVMCFDYWRRYKDLDRPARPKPIDPCLALRRSHAALCSSLARCLADQGRHCGLAGKRWVWFWAECADCGDPQPYPQLSSRSSQLSWR